MRFRAFLGNTWFRLKMILYYILVWIRKLGRIKLDEVSSCSTASAQGKVNFGYQLEGFYGQHRSGWAYAVRSLAPLHNSNGVYLDVFVERTFCWHPVGVRPHRVPWVGFIHVPPNVPKWFQHKQSNDYIFQTEAWKESYALCRGLFTLSEYHKKSLEKKLDVPIVSLVHPTETPDLKWNWRAFSVNENKKIVQVGWYLRKLHGIFMLPARSYSKIFLKITNFDLTPLIEDEKKRLIESGEFQESMYDTAEIVTYLPNEEYDKLLSENIIFVNLYDASANNAVIECIVRNTPLLVNPIEPVVEYLGPEYPFYYQTFEEAVEKAENYDTVRAAFEYLRELPIKEKLDGDYFRESLMSTNIYANL